MRHDDRPEGPLNNVIIPFPEAVFRRPLRHNANAVCGALLIMYAMMFALPFAEVWALRLLGVDLATMPRLYTQLLSIAVYSLYFLVPILCIRRWTGVPTRAAFPMRRPRFGLLASGMLLCLGISVIGQLVSVYLFVFVRWLTGISSSASSTPVPQGMAELCAYIVYNTLLPAVFEEALFRGVILQSLRRFGDGFALVISSILFGLCHGNFIQTPNAILMGIAIGYYVLRTGSLLSGMIIHLVNNLLAISTSVVGLYNAEAAALLSRWMVPAFILCGLAGAIWTIIREGVPPRPAPSVYPLRTSRKFLTFFTAPLTVPFVLMSVVLLFRLYTYLFRLFLT